MIARLVRLRWVLVALVVLVIGALSPGVQHALVPDNALTVWFLETDPQLVSYNEFQQTFGNDEVILLLIEEPDSVFTASSLKQIDRLSEKIEAVEGVRFVHSVLTVQDVWDSEEGLVFRSLIPTPIPDDPAVMEAAQRRALANPMFRDRLVSADGKEAMLWIEMDVMGDIDAKRDTIVAEVQSLADHELGETPHPSGGLGVIYSGLNVITQHDFGLFIGIGYLLMFAMMWWVFRSWRIVAAAIGVISIGTLVAIGIYGLFGHQLNMVTVVLPTLIIVLGVADAVHMPAAFVEVCRDRPELTSVDQLALTLRRVFVPTLLTTLTTMGGFLALSSSPMAVIRHLGIFAAIGVGVALLATFLLMTVAFAGISDTYESPEHALIGRFLGWTERRLASSKLAIVVVSLVLVGVAALFASAVEDDTYTIGYMPDDHKVVRDHKAIEAAWGYYSILDFMVRPAEGHRVDDPEVIAGLARFVETARRDELIRDGFSLADVYGRMAAVFGGDALGERDSKPLTPEQIEQLSLVLASQRLEWDKGKPAYRDNFLAPLMTRDGKLGRLTLTGQMISAKHLDALLHRLDADGKEAMGGVATLEPAGYPPLYVKIIDYVMSSQIRGFFIALGVIFVMMVIGLRSVRLALISLPPNLFPVLVMMGVMGIMEIHLDVATATVGAIVIGVAIDDTVHFLHHWRVAEAQALSWSDSVAYVFRHAGKAAVMTTLLLVGGFPVLMLADVKTVYYFGLLTTVAALAALYADLFILPLLLRAWPARPTQSSTGVDVEGS